jgi:membrane-bound lytic murein transglycosylase D
MNTTLLKYKLRFLWIEVSVMQFKKFIKYSLILLLATQSILAFAQDTIPPTTQLKDQYSKKLTEANFSIPVFYNNAVRLAILDMLPNAQRKTSSMLTLAKTAMDRLGHKFDSAGFPKELALLAVVNTNYNPNFVNRNNGASGIWPMTFSVAKRYGLKTNSFVDQRRNIDRSTVALIEYLKDLENIYQDWHFVITAFYAGPINLNMAIRKAGNTLVYEKVHEAMDAEQKQCLERFMALLYIYNFHADHQITFEKPKLTTFDTVCTSVALNLNFVAEKIEYRKNTIREINTEFLTAIVPIIPDCNCFTLPTEFAAKYRVMREEIEIKEEAPTPDSLITDSLSQDSLVAQNIVIQETEKSVTPTGVPKDIQTKTDNVLIYYTVKSGDNLGLISKLFDCSIKQIQTWNNMRGTVLYSGNKLKIYVPSHKQAEYKKINNMTMAQKQAAVRSK